MYIHAYMGPHVYNCMYTYTYVHVRMYILCTDTSYMYNYISYVRSMLWENCDNSPPETS